jgi:Zn-finger nucleic acid-binding protein
MSAPLCPDCRIEMEAQKYYGVVVDVCPACAGVWLDEGELRALMQVDPLILLSIDDRALPDVQYNPEEVVQRRCPRCAVLLHPYRYLYESPVELDGCDAVSWYLGGQRRAAQGVRGVARPRER